jgi:thiol-disulfide isomerase/thioredoxin
MKYFLLFLVFISVSCTKQELTLNGVWKLTISLQDQQLPVIISLTQNSNQISGFLVNSSEKIPLEGTIEENKFNIQIGSHYANLQGALTREGIKGQWVRTNKDDYSVLFIGRKSSKLSLYKEFENQENLLNITGKWKVEIGESKKLGLGLFKQTGSRVQGSILTSTGDYRFLDGVIKNNVVKLTGFDGVFSFVVEALVSNEKFMAKMYSGKSSINEIVGVKDDKFTLEDPNSMTKITSSLPVKMNLKDISGNVIDLDSVEYKDKVKVIQLFGSWCPNCIDETNFFLKWRKENESSLSSVKFIALSFEKTSTEKEAIKNLRKVKRKLGMNYPIILADFNKTKEITAFLPLDKVRAFPTTVFLGRDNKVYKVHTGFAGQATGEFFSNFEKDFDETISKLLGE